MSKQIPAVGYVRCSTEQQEDSPEQQKKSILEFATKNGFNILEWFIDFGKSGTNFDQRLEWQRLRQIVEGKPPFEAVICYDESRWGRPIDPEESTYWRYYFRQRGVEIVLVKTSIDPKNEFAPMMKSFEGIQASQYSKKLSELVLRGGISNKGYSNGGLTPYGYKRVAINLTTGSQRDLSDKQWAVQKQEKVKLQLGDPEEVNIVKLIYKLRLQGKAYALIAEALNLQGVPCPKRGRSRNRDQKWSSTTISRILDNPVYYGASVYNRVTTSKIIARQKGLPTNHTARKPVNRNPVEEWSIEESAYPEIISYETWKQVNDTNRREFGVRRNQHTLKSTYLLSGLMKCSVCGYPFQGWSITRNGHKYQRYLCGGHEKKRVCEACSFKARPLEDFAIKAIKETLQETLLSGKIAEYLEKLMDVDPRQQEVIKDRVKKALEENDRKRKNLADAISLSENAKAIATLVEKLEQLEAEAEALNKQSILDQKVEAIEIEVEFHAEAVKRFIEEFEDAIRNATEDVKKTILRKCISGILVDREAKKFKFDIRKVPAVTPELERRYTIRKPLSVTLANVMSATTNGGTTWTSQTSGTTYWLYGVAFTDTNTGWAVGQAGTILYTTNGGTTWTFLNTEFTEDLFAVTFADVNNVWAVGHGGTILHITYDGVTRMNQTCGTSSYLRGIKFTDVNNGWIVGDNGTILHTNNGGATFISNESSHRLPNRFVLSQNYPNPFNSKTEISYSLPTSGKVTLAVFDMMGRKVATLVNGVQNPSQHRVMFDGSKLATGTYLYRLNVSGVNESRKMILLK